MTNTTDTPQEPAPPTPDDVATESASAAVDLPRGRSMQPEEALTITRAAPTQVVVIAGAEESGKSTLLASIYERFLRGPWAGFQFAGSSTLLGFEQLCHPGRGVSGRQRPHTHRTKLTQGRQLLHLRLRPENGGDRKDMLLSDLSGEEFGHIRDSILDAQDLGMVKAAHHFVLLIDGEKIADPKLRQKGRDDASLLLRIFVEQGLLREWSRVDLVFSKWDVADNAATRTEATAFADLITDELTAKYSSRLARMRSFKVSARDPTGALLPAHGIEDAIRSWVLDGPVSTSPSVGLTEPADACEYDRFYRRRIPLAFQETCRATNAPDRGTA